MSEQSAEPSSAPGSPLRGAPDSGPSTAPPGQAAGDFVLTLVCPDRPGIVHAASGFLIEHGGNIIESQQFGDQITNRFFMRIDFEIGASGGAPPTADDLRDAFAPVAAEYEMSYELWAARSPYRTLIMASKHLHCLNDLLFRWSTGSLQIEIPAVVSNHREAERLCDAYGLAFHHIPVTADNKDQAERELLDLVRRHGVDLVVLARYMQVLSDDLCRTLAGKVINIHHSFLPSFKGARPYHQAYDRGVKLVGATAHYVTADLDEGPIIEQDTLRVDHTYNQDQLVAAGRDVEAQVLSRAVRWHAESRVLLNGHRTVVFR
jgi:formyltetrahydrofolate deformylase